MKKNRLVQSCIYNVLYSKFNQDITNEINFNSNLKYPSFYNLKNSYFHVNERLLNKINNNIKNDINSFKSRLQLEQETINSDLELNNQQIYKLISTYDITFNKNHVLSSIFNYMCFVDKEINEDMVNYYSIDLLTGNLLTIEDLFNHDVDYMTVIKKYIYYKISQNKSLYYDDINLNIDNNLLFYLTDEEIVLCFKPGILSEYKNGTIYFRMSFDKFYPYIKDRYTCISNNLV